MSGVFKAVGKVFKKVVKVVKKVAIPALMIGAVVLTGGAALGALPALGTMLGSIGISGGLASALGSAISMGAVGAVTGGLGSAIQGGSIFSGAKKGFLVGAATGGLLGAAGAVSPNGILSDIGIGSKAAHVAGLNAGQAVPVTAGASQAGSISQAATRVAAGLPPPVTSPLSAASAGAAAASTAAPQASGLLSSALVPSLVQGAGQIISGFASGAATGKAAQEEAKQRQLDYDRAAYNYGYRNIYQTDRKGRTVGGIPTSQERIFNYTDPVFVNPREGLMAAFAETQGQPYFQIVNGQVVQTMPQGV